MNDSQELEIKKHLYTRIMDVYRRKGAYIPLFQWVVRTGLRLKVVKDRIEVSLFLHVKEQGIKEWLDRTRLFFGFGLFRSGTTFLANFLAKVTPDAVILHEANVDDYWYYHSALQSETEAEKYVSMFRLAEIYYRMHNRREGLYGEISPFLRRHCKALQKQLPRAKFFHLVRDGRNVVRSIMSREILGRTDPLGHLTYPPPDDPYATRWKEMSRFEKVCWLWQCDNRYLRENIGLTLQFEKLITDYDYFKTRLSDPIGFGIPRATWQEYTRRIGNPTQVFRMDHWSGWSDSEREIFRNICGEEMLACGYEFE